MVSRKMKMRNSRRRRVSRSKSRRMRKQRGGGSVDIYLYRTTNSIASGNNIRNIFSSDSTKYTAAYVGPGKIHIVAQPGAAPLNADMIKVYSKTDATTTLAARPVKGQSPVQTADDAIAKAQTSATACDVAASFKTVGKIGTGTAINITPTPDGADISNIETANLGTLSASGCNPPSGTQQANVKITITFP